MAWLSASPSEDVAPAAPAFGHPSHHPEHMPSPLHHVGGHGAAHDFRHRLTEAVVVGDFARLHHIIAEAELHHVVPHHLGLMLDLCWAPGANTHEERARLSNAINHAMELAKEYHNLEALFVEIAHTAPHGPVRVELREKMAAALAPMAQVFGQARPGPARDKAQQLARELLAMI